MSEETTEKIIVESSGGFKIGDRVQFMHVSGSLNRMSFSTREGKIDKFSSPTGKYAIIKMKNGRFAKELVTEIRSMEQKSPVNDVVQGIFAQARDKEEG